MNSNEVKLSKERVIDVIVVGPIGSGKTTFIKALKYLECVRSLTTISAIGLTETVRISLRDYNVCPTCGRKKE